MREGRPELVAAVQADILSARVETNPEYARLLHELQPVSYMIVPLVVGTTTIGAMSLVSSESRRTYEHRHLHLASALAHRAALALEHARLYKRANQAIVARDAFVSIAAHELKSPLTALNGYAQLLYDRANANPSADAFQRRALQTILTQSKRLEHLIGTMLDVSLIENDQLALDLGPVCIPDLVQQVVESQRMIVDMHQIDIEVKAAQPPYVLGDASRLEQMFQNLLQNAVKYSPNGGRVQVTVEDDDQQVVIAVADTGIGIAADDIPRLFQRFYRASSAEHSNIKGMGIGLYVVREIVERHGGTIDSKASNGRALCFGCASQSIAAPRRRSSSLRSLGSLTVSDDCISRGKSVVSRTFGTSTRRASQRSRPIAKPPWGGIPYLNASR